MREQLHYLHLPREKLRTWDLPSRALVLYMSSAALCFFACETVLELPPETFAPCSEKASLQCKFSWNMFPTSRKAPDASSLSPRKSQGCLPCTMEKTLSRIARAGLGGDQLEADHHHQSDAVCSHIEGVGGSCGPKRPTRGLSGCCWLRQGRASTFEASAAKGGLQDPRLGSLARAPAEQQDIVHQKRGRR